MSRFTSIVLVVVGALLLLNNLGILRLSQLGSLLHTWWPAVLIVVGVLGLFGKRK